MDPEILSLLLIIAAVAGAVALVGGVDAWIEYRLGDQYTLSKQILLLSLRWPYWTVAVPAVLALALGILIGHLLLPQHLAG